ncbi:hypothetical protein SUGI_0132650 [Cryptomeria japonica]|nr:hypothetical protein SUGI_0132650 [Cryptomeria japonica]
MPTFKSSNDIDNLFDMSDGYFYAVMDCFCEKTWSHTTRYKIGYCQHCPNKVTWPAELEEERPALYFNVGMFVFEPNKLTFEGMMETLMSTTPTRFAEQLCHICFVLSLQIVVLFHNLMLTTVTPVSLQDFLNMYVQKQHKPIPLAYSLVLAMLLRHPENVELDFVKVHYCAAVKSLFRPYYS